MSKSSVLELAKKFVAAIEKEEQKPEIGKTIEVAGINWLVLDKLEKGYFAISEDFTEETESLMIIATTGKAVI